MEKLKKKSITIILCLTLLSTLAITLMSIPTVSAGYSTDTGTAVSQGMRWPPSGDAANYYRNASATRLLMWNRWHDLVPTAVFVSATPKPVGVGQEMTFIFFNPQVPTPSSDKYLYKLFITKPNGENETLPPSGAQGIYNQAIQNGMYVSDTTGAAWATWVPTEIGNYSVTVHFYGTTPSHTDPAFTSYDWWGVTLKESTYTTTFTVVQDPQYPVGWTTVPLPTEYWSRPIEGQNTDWYQVASNWLNNAHDKNNGGYNNKYQPDGIAPNSGHILWTKPTEDGGVVGGTSFSVQGEVFNAGHQYQTRLPQSQIVMFGRLYYRESNWYSATPGDYVCVDLQTGQEIWRNRTMTAIPEFGYYYDWDDMNQHGVVEPSWLFSSDYGLAIHPRLGITNGDGLRLKSVPGDTAEHSHNNIYGPKGEDLRYSIGGSATAGYYINQWNSSRVFISQVSGNLTANIPIDPVRPTTTASTTTPQTAWIYNTTTASWTSSTTTSSSGYAWYWYTTSATSGSWRYTTSASMTASGLGTNTATGFDWNVTISPKFSSSPTIRAILYNDMMLLSNGSIPSAPTYTIADSATFWAISLKPESRGTLLWGPINIPLINSDNQQLMYQGHDEVNDIFFFQQTPDMSWVAYKLHSGQKAWQTISEGDYNPYAYYISSTGYNPEGWSVAYGKLFSTGYVGMVFAYDTKDGSLLWKHDAPTYMEKFEYYTLMINAICDGKIYIGTHEHSADTPLFKNSHTRCLNVTTGEVIWEMIGWANPYTTQVADGVLTYWNNYDQSVYAVGKGPSEMTTYISQDVVPFGSSVLIKGTVMDISAGTKQKEQAARFPNGVPAISDATQSEWMEYVYMQKPRPSSATGVDITLSVVDANGNYREIGQTISDADGFFSFNWKPDIDGKYTVYASFGGSNSYWPSHAVTAFAVDSAAATATPTPMPQPSMADTYLLPGIAAIIIAIAIVGLVIVLMLRKKP
jgi:outer membrane protein assembly factor BamB